MIVIYNDNDNYNTGIEYEISVLLLCISKNKEKLNNIINQISKRDDYEKIMSIYKEMLNNNENFINTILDKFNINSLDKIELTTQRDDVGPGDILINDKFGISIKYNNKCNFNPTGKNFLTNNDILNFKNELNNFVDEYIDEMNETHGNSSNWFRVRGIKSKKTNNFIDKIKNKIIFNWDNNIISKKDIINKIYHLDSPMDYIILNINKKNEIDFSFILNEFNVDNIKLINEKNTQYVIFKDIVRDEIIGKMQVKFNNGVLEKSKTKNYILLDEFKIKIGNPLTSWNFNLY